MYNTLLYIGITFLLSGFVLFVIAVNMEIYYDRKLYKLQQRMKNESNKILKPYNRKLALSLTEPEMPDNLNKNMLKKIEEDYQDSFGNIISFASKFSRGSVSIVCRHVPGTFAKYFEWC